MNNQQSDTATNHVKAGDRGNVEHRASSCPQLTATSITKLLVTVGQNDDDVSNNGKHEKVKQQEIVSVWVCV